MSTSNSHAAPPYPLSSDIRRSGLVYLRDRVADYFASNNLPAVVAPVGLKYRSFTINQNPILGGNRIVFIPGKFEGDAAPKPRDYGELSRQTRNSASVVNPQEIGQWARLFTISVWAPQPPGTSGDEQAATEVADDLLEQVFRAVTYAPSPSGESMQGSIIWGTVTVNSPPNDNAFGSELLVVCSQLGPIFGQTLEVVQASPKLATEYKPL